MPEQARTQMICDIPAEERPRERMAMVGASALSNRELLAIILRHGTRGKSALALAQELLDCFGNSLNKLSMASPEQLAAVHGIGTAKSLELKASIEIARRLAAENMGKRIQLNKPEVIAEYIYGRIEHEGQEEVHALFLDSKLRLIRDSIITVGLVDRCQIHPREVFRAAIQENSSCIVVCHNHPSGDIQPSKEDVASTEILWKAGKLLGISLLDHIVIGKTDEGGQVPFFSFRQNGLVIE